MLLITNVKVDFFGFLNLDISYIVLGLLVLVVILLVLLIANIVKTNKIRNVYDQFMSGKDAKTLEDVILTRFQEVDALKTTEKKQNAQIAAINEALKKSFSKCGIIKYDAFNEMGGKLSFALVLLDKSNNGYVINAMHSREGCYTYIKEIVNGESYITLGEEEKKALAKAMGTDVT